MREEKKRKRQLEEQRREEEEEKRRRRFAGGSSQENAPDGDEGEVEEGEDVAIQPDTEDTASGEEVPEKEVCGR